ENFFEKVKEIDRKRMKMVFDTPEGIMKWMSEELVYRYPQILLPADLISIYDSISTADILGVARRTFDKSKINISVLQNFKNCNKIKFEHELKELIQKLK